MSFDTINMFEHGLDKINLGGIDADAFTAGNQAFTFIGASDFSAAGAASAGQLRLYEVEPNTWQVEGDVNGDGIADFVVQILNPTQAPTVDDFGL
jgi:hypothetical protein